MKKNALLLAVSALLLLTALVITGCAVVEFDISFVSEGEVIHTVETNGGEAIKLPSEPTREGYVFDGWYWDKDTWQRPFTASSLLNEPLKSDMSVYAKWIDESELEQSYTVSFNSVGGSQIEAQEVKYNDLVSKPLDPVRDGYAFSGWYLDADYESKWSFDTERVKASVTLYAKWTRIGTGAECEIVGAIGATLEGKTVIIDVPYSTESLSVYEHITVSEGATYIVTRDIEGSDQIASGTVTLSEGENVFYILVTSENGVNKSLYTVKINRAESPRSTVTFDTDGGSQIEAQSVKQGALVTKPTDPTKGGYNFVGWYVDRDYTRQWNFEVDKANEKITLYAKWEVARDTTACELISISDANIEDKVATIGVPYSSATLELSKGITVSEGATYILSRDIEGRDQIATGTVTLSEGENTLYILVTAENGVNKSLYTVKINRAENPNATVIFDIDGKQEGSTYAKGTSIEKPSDPFKAGNCFLGWTIDGEIVAFPYTVTKDVVLTASWANEEDIALVEFFVEPPATLNMESSVLVLLKGQSLSSVITNMPSASRDNHRINGWTDKDGRTVTLITEINDSLTLYPVWERIVYCTDGTENHRWGPWDHTEPTCTEPWEKSRMCQICGYMEFDVGDVPTGHSYGPWGGFEIIDNKLVQTRKCEREGCEYKLTIPYNNIIFDAFETPTYEGDCWGGAYIGKLTDGDFSYNRGNICLKSTGFVVTLEAKKPVYIDAFTVTGYGSAAYEAEYFSESGSCIASMAGYFGNEENPTYTHFVHSTVQRIVITIYTDNDGIDFLTELAAYTKYEQGDECVYVTNVTTEENVPKRVVKECIFCGEKEEYVLNNITFDNFKTPTYTGNCWGDKGMESLIDGEFSQEQKIVVPNGNGEFIVTLEAKEATYVDIFSVTGYGYSSYTVTAVYADGGKKAIGIGSFTQEEGATRCFVIAAEVTKIMVSMSQPSQGSDYWTELGAYTRLDTQGKECVFEEKVITEASVPKKLIKKCKLCGRTEEYYLDNITFDNFKTPTLQGDCYNGSREELLIDGDFAYNSQKSIGTMPGSLIVTLEAKAPVYIDVFSVTGYGFSTYTVKVIYADGDEASLGAGTFANNDETCEIATKGFLVESEVAKIIVTVEDSYYGYLTELGAYTRLDSTQCVYDKAVITQGGEPTEVIDECISCDKIREYSMNKVDLEAFTITYEGECYSNGGRDVGVLTNGDFSYNIQQAICPRGTSEFKVTLSAISPVYIDMFSITGYGSSPYLVDVCYEDGEWANIGVGSFGEGEDATCSFFIGKSVTKIVVTMYSPSQGSDYWTELSAYTLAQKEY